MWNRCAGRQLFFVNFVPYAINGIRYKGSKNEGKSNSLTGSFIEKFSNRIELFARIRSVSLRQSLGNLHREMCMD